MNAMFFLRLCALLLIFFPWCTRAQTGIPFSISASAENDVIRLLERNGIPFNRFDGPEEAIDQARPASGVLLLAVKYPERRVSLSWRALREIRRKNLQVYIEYPQAIPGVRFLPETKQITLERGVVLSQEISGVDSLDILSINDHIMLQARADTPLITVAKVAGYDRADYGLEDTETFPLLFRQGNFLIATTRLSDAVHSRFGPTARWGRVWAFILNQMHPDMPAECFNWTPAVHPTYDRAQLLPEDAVRSSVLRGSRWFYNARLLIHPSWQDTFLNRTRKNGEGVVFPTMNAHAPVGDGSYGILEGHASYINADGSQPVRWWLRADCQAEVAFALSSAARLLDTGIFRETAENLLHALYQHTNLRQGERDDPESPSFGLIGWATTDPDAYYGDDNARVLLSTIGAASNLQTHAWDSYIIEGILGNFRTAGTKGFRGPWFRDAAMQQTTWQALSQRDIVNVHPHYESWLWACYLWLYDKTQYTPFLDKARSAIRITMEAYPDWKWTNGIQQEYARMILPLAWLVRVEDTPIHRSWLKTVAEALLKNLQPSGAIPEALGKSGMGRYEKIKSNAEYGEKEAPLISENGDPVTDLLYTMNFAFFSLNEAAGATGEDFYSEAVDKIRDYLIRIQVRSPEHPELDGSWFRAFDYARWDYWASNADSGWGPWGTQTGWTQSWILNSMMLHQAGENYWDRTALAYKNNPGFKKLVTRKIKQMLD